ncbi:hypothetical protein [Diaminobutyricibacter sp. McL0608]|uniref:hypothetical protein n=1 Tax=Leifsonia sp. McL0608 TaxID=3143537 RepID=UPI0031F32A4E
MVRTIALLLVTLALGAGCSELPVGGQSDDEALAQISAIEGIEKVFIDAKGSYNGFQRETGTLVSVTLSPGFRVARMPVFAEYLLRLAWSVNVERPNRDLTFTLKNAPHSEFESAFRDAGWVPTLTGDTYVFIPPEVVREKLGPWPGPVPETPAGMLVRDTQAVP